MIDYPIPMTRFKRVPSQQGTYCAVTECDSDGSLIELIVITPANRITSNSPFPWIMVGVEQRGVISHLSYATMDTYKTEDHDAAPFPPTAKCLPLDGQAFHEMELSFADLARLDPICKDALAQTFKDLKFEWEDEFCPAPLDYQEHTDDPSTGDD